MAMSLTNAIKFRSLMDQLTKQEFAQFMNKLFDLNKSCLIKTSLFHYFTQIIHKKNNSDSQDLENINAILCNIIQSRKKKPKALPITNIKLNELPKSIIGHTASFLEQDDYFQFEKTNRSIFIGCKAPNMLIQLNLCSITDYDYSSINLSEFRSLKKLRIDITKFNEFILPNNGKIIMKELNELTLDAKFKKDFEIESFMNQNCINMTNIKTLTLYAFGDIGEGNKFDINKFYALLTKFPNVECLILRSVFINPHLFDVSKLKQLYPDLKGLSVVGGHYTINNALVNEFGNNLHFLTHYFYHHSSIDFSNINFNKLQEIKLEGCAAKTVNDVLKTGKNIEKFALCPHFLNTAASLTEQELKDIIPQILKCKSLTYFEIEANNKNCIAILDGIEKGLFETIKWERKQIKIRVCAQYKSKINIKEIIFNIGRIIHWLLSESSNINDFMFIFDMNKIHKKLKKQLDPVEILNDLNNMSSKIQVLTDGFLFLITSKNCQINGFGSRWMEKIKFSS